MMPKRVQRKRSKGWRMPTGCVYVGRPTNWGNPFVIGEHGTREQCVELYRKTLTLCGDELHAHIWGYMDDLPSDLLRLIAMRGHLKELRGKDLSCWCSLDVPCHADVLIELANKGAMKR